MDNIEGTCHFVGSGQIPTDDGSSAGHDDFYTANIRDVLQSGWDYHLERFDDATGKGVRRLYHTVLHKDYKVMSDSEIEGINQRFPEWLNGYQQTHILSVHIGAGTKPHWHLFHDCRQTKRVGDGFYCDCWPLRKFKSDNQLHSKSHPVFGGTRYFHNLM